MSTVRPSVEPSLEGRALLIDELARRSQIASFIPRYISLTRAFPNTTYDQLDGSVAPASDWFVVGEVIDAEPGIGLGLGGDSDVPLDYDDEAAGLVTVHVVVRVEEAFGPDGPADLGTEIRFGLATGPATNREQLRAGAAALGRVALFLRESDPDALFGYADGVFQLLDGGQTLVLVNADGSLQFPVVPEAAATFTAELPTVESMIARAAEPPSHGGSLGG